MILARRKFLVGLGALIAAPAIVCAARLMPVRGIILPADKNTPLLLSKAMYEQLCDVTRQAFVPRLFVQVYATPPLVGFLSELE